jgi:sRNA-binding regulator protein Hfq
VEQKMQAGRILEETPFDIKLQPEQGDALEIHKHDVKFYFEAGEKKQILKQVTWGPAERKLPPEHFRKKKNRKDIKAIFFFGRQEEGKGIRWETAEGDQLRGKVAWLGRFEIVLELPKGQRVIMMRHAVVAAD